jgi:hypothetical protein
MNNLVLVEDTDVAPSDVFLDGKSMKEYELVQACSSLVEEMKVTGDTKKVEEAILNLNGIQSMAARAKSTLIHEWYEFWIAQNPEGDFAEMYVENKGGSKLEIQKHLAIGELLTSPDVPDEVKLLSNKELLAPARALQSGYDLSGSWDEIKIAGSEAEVNEIVRKVKNKEPRQGSLSLSVYPDGTIMAWMDNVMVNVGWLNYPDRENEEDEVKKKVLTLAISRITNNSRMSVK